ncbi:phenylalanine--tRNA ligase subunit beta [Williamsia sp. CHRR-6]|uniref:phenylalanine--tRNA ligase subunit beta n=1 Tax=Williamsia sp. CHRR-6 TaxID=2835871 RepID=UPI001BDB176D|nr:phenylalanine--tRNA ligase subunit beta [Williamsia sp. CHRR-6]MBT0565166.1 phenylalanine--tRNA ligase subunit beta [Williamsia sp. CHRR-6]
MRVPQSWMIESLRAGAPDFVATTDELDTGFVRVGFEIEEVAAFPTITGPLVVGRVSAIEELDGFKKPIRFCQVDVGEDKPRGIVCGARNFAEGDLIVAALPGVVLPGDFAIAARSTYGRTSDGMICSVSELGIGNDHSGILVLAPGTATPGASAHEVLGLDDVAIDVNVTPDRGYAFSARGLSRELAASFDLPFVDPAAPGSTTTPGPGARPVRIDPDSKAIRYCAQLITGVNAAAISPWWIQKRLLVAGVRPISAVVDVTNYVMLELGQPLHAFDADRVGGTITVRRAAVGERLHTLDGVERTLDADDVVIADDNGPIALAGVMGGAVSEVGDQTTDVIIEAATFDPVAVFRTGRRHRLSSEAGKRFERSVDPEVTDVALARAVALITEIAGGTAETGVSQARVDVARPTVTMPIDLPARVAGVSYPEGATVRRLEQVGCVVQVGDTVAAMVEVTPPSWRPDLRQPADLVEEVVRLEGLENIPPIAPAAPAGSGLTAAQRRRRSVGRALAGTGFVEVLPFPFMPTDVMDLWDVPADDVRRRVVSVLNPLESARAELNTTLLPGLVEMAARNIARGQRDLALFTIGQVVIGTDATGPVEAIDVSGRPSDEQVATLMGSLPDQPLRVAAVLTGSRELPGPWGTGRPAEAADAFEAARVVARAAGVRVRLEADTHVPFHPGRCARVVTDDDDAITVGWAGELHPSIVEKSALPARACAVELELDRLPIRTELPAPQLSLFPAVLQDVAVVVADTVPAAAVERALTLGAGELLEDIRLYDVFVGSQVGEGHKSLTFALRFRAHDRTLTEDDATAARTAAVERASVECGARLR